MHSLHLGFEKELEEKIRQITDPADIDYVVMNHAEPDYAGSIPHTKLDEVTIKIILL